MPIIPAPSDTWVVNGDHGIGRQTSFIELISVFDAAGGAKLLRVSLANGQPIDVLLPSAIADHLGRLLSPTIGEAGPASISGAGDSPDDEALS